MKIKKVNELNTTKLSEEELNKWRLEEFIKHGKYRIWAEYYDNDGEPWYDLLTTCRTLDECAAYYNSYNKIISKKCDDILLTEDTVILLDIETIVNSKKYNL